MEMIHVEPKPETEEEKTAAISYGSDRAWHFLALGFTAAVVGMLVVVVADLLMRASS
jgi:hypothetical protein